jgi:hypothetical protein
VRKLSTISSVAAALVLGSAALILAGPVASASTSVRPNVDSPTCGTTTALTYGEAPTTLTIATAGKTACGTFTAVAGDNVFTNIDVTSGSIALFLDVFNSNGTSLCGGPYNEGSACTIDTSGTATIQISDSSGTHTGSMAVAIQRLNSAVGCGTVAFGTKTTKVKIKTAAAIPCVTFSAKSGAVLYGRGTVVKGDISSTDFFLGSPNGSLPCGGAEGNGIDCTLSDNGTQSLLFFANSGQTGAFDLVLQRMNKPVGCAKLTKNGAADKGVISTAGQALCFTFSGKNKEDITGTVSGMTGTFSSFMDLFSPSGVSTLAGPGTVISDTLDKTGEWTFLIYDSSGKGIGDFDIRLT